MIPYYTRFFIAALVLLFLQILVFDHVNLFGFSNPAVYIILLISYRLDIDQFGFIVIGFLIGFFLDLLTQTAGSHSIACVTAAYSRPLIARFAFGANLDLSTALSSSTLWTNRMIFVFLIIFIHQILFSFMAFFSMTHLWIALKYTLVNSVFSFILIAASLTLLKPKK
ncbi:MAG: hypothetical protein ACPIB2_01190 [Flavobacteriaceae bacterium]